MKRVSEIEYTLHEILSIGEIETKGLDILVRGSKAFNIDLGHEQDDRWGRVSRTHQFADTVLVGEGHAGLVITVCWAPPTTGTSGPRTISVTVHLDSRRCEETEMSLSSHCSINIFLKSSLISGRSVWTVEKDEEGEWKWKRGVILLLVTFGGG